MRLLILTQYYPPEIGAPQNRLSALAKGLVDAGHAVTVLTAMPNYPVGKIQPGYGGFLRRENMEGVDVIRTFIYPTQSPSRVKRLANYFSFVFSSLFIGGWFVRRHDFILTESPPLFLGITGYLMSRWKRMRWIFNVSDLWPESAVRLGMLGPGIALRLSEKLEAFCYKKSWLVSGQAPSILEHIQQRFPSVPTFLLSNGVDSKRFSPEATTPAARAKLAPSSSCVVLYAGLHGLAQGVDQILESASQLTDNDKIHFVFVGDGPEKKSLIKQAVERKLGNVTFLDPMPQKEMPSLVASADIIVVPLKTFIPGAVPSKLYESMSSGRPVVLMATGEPAQIVSRYQAGIALDPGDIKGLTSALQALSRDPDECSRLGNNGRQTACQHYDRSVILSQFIEHLEKHL